MTEVRIACAIDATMRPYADRVAATLSAASGLDWRIVHQEPYQAETAGATGVRFGHSIISGQIHEIWTSTPTLEWELHTIGVLPIAVVGVNHYVNTLHHHIHRIEDRMSRKFGSWNTNYGAQRGDSPPEVKHDWDLFSLTYMQVPGEIAGVGNCHCAPSGVYDPGHWDYEWDNTWPVWSTCDRWPDYPNSNAPPRRIDRDTWGKAEGNEPGAMSYETGFYHWYLAHLPKVWWRDVVPAAFATPSVPTPPSTPPPPPPLPTPPTSGIIWVLTPSGQWSTAPASMRGFYEAAGWPVRDIQP